MFCLSSDSTVPSDTPDSELFIDFTDFEGRVVPMHIFERMLEEGGVTVDSRPPCSSEQCRLDVSVGETLEIASEVDEIRDLRLEEVTSTGLASR
jgi:hypothetical protein